MAANQHSTIITHVVFDDIFSQVPEAFMFGKILIPENYCNLTEILKGATNQTGKKKQWSNYYKSESNQAYLAELSNDLKLPITKTSYDLTPSQQGLQPLIIVVKGGDPATQGTWGHPLVAKHLAMWCSPKFAVAAIKLIDAVIHKEGEHLERSIESLKPIIQSQWKDLRALGKIARRGLTDSIKDYLLRHPNLSERYETWIYSDVSDCLNVALFGMKAEPLCIKRGCARNKLRDTHSAEQLREIENRERHAMFLIDKSDCEPLKAVQEAIEFYS